MDALSTNSVNMAANNTAFKGKDKKQLQPNSSKPNEESEKKIKTALAVLGVAGLVGIGITATIRKGKVVQLSEVEFNKGVASLKDSNEKFTGVIKDTLKNGDTIKMKYKDGVLQKTTRKGQTSFVKCYQYDNDGKLSKVFNDGDEIDVLKLKDKAKKVFNDNGATQGVTQKSNAVPPVQTQKHIPLKDRVKPYGKLPQSAKARYKALKSLEPEKINALSDENINTMLRDLNDKQFNKVFGWLKNTRKEISAENISKIIKQYSK